MYKDLEFVNWNLQTVDFMKYDFETFLITNIIFVITIVFVLFGKIGLSHRDNLPSISKCPKSVSNVTVVRLQSHVMIGKNVNFIFV